MKKLLLVIASGFFLGNAWAAGPECTTADQSTWMSEQDFKDKVIMLGYATDQFSVSEGNCYTLTKLEASDAGDLEYFDPVSGEPIIQ